MNDRQTKHDPDDDSLRELLSDLKKLKPPPKTRQVILQQVTSALASTAHENSDKKMPIWRRTIAVPWPISSYLQHGSGAGTGTSQISLGTNYERRFWVIVQSKLSSGQYMANVRVEPRDGDSVTAAMEREFIISNLDPQTIEIARNDDGRVYRLQIIPRIVEPEKPSRLSVVELKLDQWSFPGSVVILNDQDYVGRIGGSGGPMASIDLPGVAKVEFSPVPFRGAEPDGVLKDGVVTLRRADGTTIQIANVRIGVQGNQLSIGPYSLIE